MPKKGYIQKTTYIKDLSTNEIDELIKVAKDIGSKG